MVARAASRAESEEQMRIGDLQGKKIGICVSGGLDSKSVTARLKPASST